MLQRSQGWKSWRKDEGLCFTLHTLTHAFAGSVQRKLFFLRLPDTIGELALHMESELRKVFVL